jgi:hypothetical protein
MVLPAFAVADADDVDAPLKAALLFGIPVGVVEPVELQDEKSIQSIGNRRPLPLVVAIGGNCLKALKDFPFSKVNLGFQLLFVYF